MAAREIVRAIREKIGDKTYTRFEKRNNDGTWGFATWQEYQAGEKWGGVPKGGAIRNAADAKDKASFYKGMDDKDTAKLAEALNSGARIDARKVARDFARSEAQKKNLRAAMFYGGLEDQARNQWGNQRAASMFGKGHDLSMRSFRNTAPSKNRNARHAMYWYLKER